MRIAVDFDGTLVDDDREYADFTSPLKLKVGARQALQRLKYAQHTIIVCSARSNLALREDWRLNQLWLSGAVRFDPAFWAMNLEVNRGRYEQMVTFVATELVGLVDAVDDGRQGKLMVDLFIDDRAVCLGQGAHAMNWRAVAELYGAPAAESSGL